MTIDAELRVPAATAQLVRFDLPGPVDETLREEDAYWLDLCLTPRPRNARGCYRDRFGRHRFERIGSVFVRPPGECLQARSGCSIGSYVALIQVEHAKRLLATQQSIKAIAYSLGFSSPSKFALAFRRATRQTPREFRDRMSRR